MYLLINVRICFIFCLKFDCSKYNIHINFHSFKNPSFFFPAFVVAVMLRFLQQVSPAIWMPESVLQMMKICFHYERGSCFHAAALQVELTSKGNPYWELTRRSLSWFEFLVTVLISFLCTISVLPASPAFKLQFPPSFQTSHPPSIQLLQSWRGKWRLKRPTPTSGRQVCRTVFTWVRWTGRSPASSGPPALFDRGCFGQETSGLVLLFYLAHLQVHFNKIICRVVVTRESCKCTFTKEAFKCHHDANVSVASHLGELMWEVFVKSDGQIMIFFFWLTCYLAAGCYVTSAFLFVMLT